MLPERAPRFPSFWALRSMRNNGTFVLAGLIIIGSCLFGSIKLASDSDMSGKRTLEPRQFQLGGMLGGHLQALELDGDVGLNEIKSLPNPSSHLGTDSISATSLASTSTSSGFASNTPVSDRVGNIAETETISNSTTANDLFANLVEAFKPIINSTSLLAGSTDEQYNVATETDLSRATMPQSTGSINTVPTTSAAQFTPGSSSKILEWTKLQRRYAPASETEADQKGALDLSSLESGLAMSLLDFIPGLVVDVAGINVKLAAELTDGLLAALPVDATAISSAVSITAGQTSTDVELAIPLILSALAKALGRQVESPMLTSETNNVTEMCSDIVTKGSLVINQIVAASVFMQSPLMQDMLSQVADIVYVASAQLNQTVCAVSLNDTELQLEILLPCASVSLDPASVSVLTLHPSRGDSRATSWTGAPTAMWNDIPVASPEGYGIPHDTITSGFTSSPDTSMINGQLTSTAWGPSSSTWFPFCQPCPTTSAARISTPEPVAGPCPGSGYKCKECLNGWFCPPQETPPQVVPCGLGWPCFHCTGGYFCSSTSPSAYSPYTSETTSIFSTLTNAASATSEAALLTPTPEPNCKVDTGIPGWTYLGCFQDAISRTLVGSKPMDYMHGEMSRSVCINHCRTSGYSFAGTENGHECWCGVSIRDDAVRLPEDSCNMPCQDSGNEVCGGAWIISVFRCSDESVHSGVEGPGASPSLEAHASTSITNPPVYPATTVPVSSVCSTSIVGSPAQDWSGGGQTASVAQIGPVAQLLADARNLR
ncbi:hypothetical protein QQS21_012262 [Conoideocrella luteorostrata]|uniref:WSC domain-containing protein n=1 Tax=Conoideocrella luteorostrata TaxID=1105319 RepID=A0AAJ0FV09_9HYPO|nr:hypothetical protein QQS21_012262 [Conoideocrella luteorostrata]